MPAEASTAQTCHALTFPRAKIQSRPRPTGLCQHDDQGSASSCAYTAGPWTSTWILTALHLCARQSAAKSRRDSQREKCRKEDKEHGPGSASCGPRHRCNHEQEKRPAQKVYTGLLPRDSPAPPLRTLDRAHRGPSPPCRLCHVHAVVVARPPLCPDPAWRKDCHPAVQAGQPTVISSWSSRSQWWAAPAKCRPPLQGQLGRRADSRPFHLG